MSFGMRKGIEKDIIELFTIEILDGVTSSFVGIDEKTHKIYEGMSHVIHGYGGAYGASNHIVREITIEELREYAKKALESREWSPSTKDRLKSYANITEDELFGS